ncbi:GSCOCT00010964001.3-RA-CDS [Cotesia congregata]|uniref:Haem Peroxidase n=1 Tax=Cotesia congregata TaxID=51543 RepID=A0A8J2H5X9_COTCN|nr:GSCOCT00010964001.3-RA-CDS [Cotesia congregata]CAG5077492.1 Haem Peroxidase [Cotesia congregata]
MFIYILWWFILLVNDVRGVIVPSKMIRHLSRHVDDAMNKYDQKELAILNTGIQLSKDSPSWFLSLSHEISDAAKNLSKQALRSETMAIMMVEAFKMTPEDAIELLPTVTLGSGVCSDTNAFRNIVMECKNSNIKYRTYSGRCNNLLHPSWGAALESYSRILPADYQDGVSLPRLSVPSAREISINVFSHGIDIKHPYLMAITTLFGQFIANDLAHTPKMVLPNGKKFKCCNVDYDNFHPECFPIPMENYPGCMEYTRSAPHPGNIYQGCKLGSRQQMNQATSFLDLSPIYGNSEQITASLRANRSGLFSTQRKNLPVPLENLDNCRNSNKALPCFFSGDSRINESPGITLMHVLFLREHNRIAKQLNVLNRHWNDEKLFQESRRIVIAEMQHITYNEFLPVIFGESNLDRYRLRLTEPGAFTSYDPRIDPTLPNAVASAGIFFFFALTPKIDSMESRITSKSNEKFTHSNFYAPQELYESGAVDRLITSVTAENSRKPFGLNGILLKRFLYDEKTNEVVDYVARVIQEGRDHGLPRYIRWRSFCNLPQVKTFTDLLNIMSKDSIKRLQRVYRNVDDIDLITGALLEKPFKDSVMGPTFLCLLGTAFKSVRLGDRYWYENTKTPGAFTIKQLHEIRKTTLAKLLCDNGDTLKRVQPKVFLLEDSFLNPVTDCMSYQKQSIDLTAWTE